jgi:purine catabolism regulator
MGVPVSWVLAQPDLSLRLLGGSAGVLREVTLALTTELSEPFRWLSGGELVLTTGLGLPTTRAKRAAYLRGLDECGVSAVGFAIGLSHAKVPADLVAVADEIGIPLIEVPLETSFAAVVKRMGERLADQHYEAVLRVSRAQPRMTRAAVSGGASAVVAELARALSAKVLILAPSGDIIESHPRSLDAKLVDEVRAVVASAGAGTVVAGTAITYQRIKVTRKIYGALAVVTAAPLSSVDQILLGHANSLLALDFEKPARLVEAHRELNSSALGLLLSGEHDLGPARAQLTQVADTHGHIRALVIDCGSTPAIEQARAALIPAVERAGSVLFARVQGYQLIAVVPGTHDVAFARRLSTEIGAPARKLIRVGLSEPLPVGRLEEAVEHARIAAAAAERGGLPLEFTAFAGRMLLSIDSTRQVLNVVAGTFLAPLGVHDREHGSELLVSLRAFLEANGHWETAASAIGVHRHTLRKRMTFVQELIGCNLDIARVRAELLLALLAYQS